MADIIDEDVQQAADGSADQNGGKKDYWQTLAEAALPYVPCEGGTETQAAAAAAKAYCDDHTITMEQLQDRLEAAEIMGDMNKVLTRLYKMLNDFITDQNAMILADDKQKGVVDKSAKRSPSEVGGKHARVLKDVLPIFMARALLATGDIVILDKDPRVPAKSTFGIRERGIVYRSFRFAEKGSGGDELGPLMPMIMNMAGQMTATAKHNLASVMCDLFYAEAPVKSTDRSEYGYGLIPLADGVYDKRETPHTFTRWDDMDTLNERYPDFAFTWVLPWKKPEDFSKLAPPAVYDPVKALDELFDTDTPMGQASVNVIWRGFEMAIRGFSGQGGNIQWWCDGTANSGGGNGKSTTAALLKNLFLGPKMRNGNPDAMLPLGKIVGTRLDEAFGDGDFAQACFRDAALYIGDETDARNGSMTITNMAGFKQFVRDDGVLSIHIKYGDDRDIPVVFGKFVLSNPWPNMGSKIQNAMLTHTVFISFDKSFGENGDPNIGDVYVKDPEVLEYVLSYLLSLDYAMSYDPSDLAALKPNKHRVFQESAPAADFFEEVLPDFPGEPKNGALDADGRDWAKIPVKILWTMYLTWQATVNGDRNGRRNLSLKAFKSELTEFIKIHIQPGSYDLSHISDAKTFRMKEEEAERYDLKETSAIIEKYVPDPNTRAGIENAKDYSYAARETLTSDYHTEEQLTGFFAFKGMHATTWSGGYITVDTAALRETFGGTRYDYDDDDDNS